MCRELCGALAGSSLGFGLGAECAPDQRKEFHLHPGEQQLPRLGLPQELPAKLPLGCSDSDLEERFCVNHVKHLPFECLEGMLAEGSV